MCAVIYKGTQRFFFYTLAFARAWRDYRTTFLKKFAHCTETSGTIPMKSSYREEPKHFG